MFTTIQQFTQAAEDMAERKADYNLPLNAFRFSGKEVTAFDLFNQLRGGVTRRAFYQLLDRLGIQSGARYMWEHGMEFFPEQAAALLNEHLGDPRYTNLNNNGPKPVFARTYEGDFRAFLSDQYRPFDNRDLLQQAQEFIGGAPHEIVRVYNSPRSYIDPDSMYVKVVQASAQGHDVEYRFGFALKNGELGGTSVHIVPLLWRGPVGGCQNAIVIAKALEAEAKEMGVLMRIPHRWFSQKQMNLHVKTALGFALRKGPEFIDEMAVASTKVLPNAADILAELVTSRGIAQETVDTARNNAIMGMEGKATVEGIVNGLSFTAHRTEGLNQDQQAEFEFLAGSVLAASRGRDRIADLTAEFFRLAKTAQVEVEADND